MVLAILACFGLILSWAQEDYLFAGVFAAEAAFAVVEAAYLRAGGGVASDFRTAKTQIEQIRSVW